MFFIILAGHILKEILQYSPVIILQTPKSHEQYPGKHDNDRVEFIIVLYLSYKKAAGEVKKQ